MKDKSPENQVKKFLKLRIMKDRQNVITEDVKQELLRFFNKNSLYEMNHNDRDRILIFIDNGLSNYLERFTKNKTIRKHTLNHLKNLYGDEEGQIRYDKRIVKLQKPHRTQVELFLRRRATDLQSVTITDSHILELKNIYDNLEELNISKLDWDTCIVGFILDNRTNFFDLIKQLKNTQPGTLEWFNIRYGLDQGKTHYLTTNQNKRKGMPSTEEYWLHHGVTDNIQQHILDHQKMASKKSGDLLRSLKGVTCRSRQFWLDKGFSEIEAYNKVHIIQDTNSLKRYIRVYGEDLGPTKFKQRQINWQYTLNSKANEDDQNTTFRQLIKPGMASKESLKLFLPLKEFCENLGLHVFLGLAPSQEFFIREEHKMVCYDFTIRRLKIIIEYNGETWHPSSELSIEEWRNWRNPINGRDADEQYYIDTMKEEIAISRGFKVIQVWGKDAKIQPIETLSMLKEEVSQRFTLLTNLAA